MLRSSLSLAIACGLLGGCAVVTVGGAVVGAAVSVTGAVVSTGVELTGKAIGAGIDAMKDDDKPADTSGIKVKVTEKPASAPQPAASAASAPEPPASSAPVAPGGQIEPKPQPPPGG